MRTFFKTYSIKRSKCDILGFKNLVLFLVFPFNEFQGVGYNSSGPREIDFLNMFSHLIFVIKGKS